MIDKEKILAIIPARGGSKGVPNKNSRLLGGKPLISYTVELARQLFEDRQICLTTDDLTIVKIVEDLGLNVPFIRPAELADDFSSMSDVILHALNYYEENLKLAPELIVLLQPTSPFRQAQHVLKALELYFSTDCDMVVSVKESKANPYFNLFEENSHGWLEKSKSLAISRRQDSPKVWEYNGAIYVVNVRSFKAVKNFNFDRIKKIVMDQESSHDIDTPFDWKLAEMIVNNYPN